MILGGLRFRIGAVRLEKFLDVIDCVISGTEDIVFRYRCADKVIGSRILNILLDVFHLEVHQLCA